MTSLRAALPRIGAVMTVGLLAVATLARGVAAQEPAKQPDPAFASFEQRVDAYVTLHRNLAASLPPLNSRNRHAVMLGRSFLAAAIKSARPNARQGDIFTPDATRAFRHVINDTMRAADFGMLAPLMDENGRLLPGQHPRIHDPFPILDSRELPPVMLYWLPTLPEELEYRLYDYDLVLWDVYADLVVDVLPYAVAYPKDDLMYR